MSAGETPKAGPGLETTIQEVRGVFADDAALQDAIGRLTRVGFDRADLSLPDARPAASETTPEQGASDPDTEDDSRQMRTIHTSMAGSVGALAAAGLVIATGGAALPAVAAAAAAGLGAGGLANAASSASSTSQSNQRNEAAARGELVLSVRVRDVASRSRAETEMHAAGATAVAAR